MLKLLVFLLATALAQPAQAQTLESTVRARLDSLRAASSFYAKQLGTGREVAIRADQPMNTASVIKLARLRGWPAMRALRTVRVREGARSGGRGGFGHQVLRTAGEHAHPASAVRSVEFPAIRLPAAGRAV